MTNIEKTYESNGPFKEMNDKEIDELVKECFNGKTSIRTQDTIVSLRKDADIVDVFTIVRHRIYEKDENGKEER